MQLDTPWFRCFIEGQNFPGVLIGEKEPIGFYATRFVEANTPNQAEVEVLELLKIDSSLQLPLGVTRPKEAKIFFEEIELVSESEVPKRSQGFSFFVMST